MKLADEVSSMKRQNRMKWASILIGTGLLIQAVSLTVLHPLAFMAFIILGCPLLAAGIALYLSILLPRAGPNRL